MNSINVWTTKFSIDQYIPRHINKYLLIYGATKTHNIKTDKTFKATYKFEYSEYFFASRFIHFYRRYESSVIGGKILLNEVSVGTICSVYCN